MAIKLLFETPAMPQMIPRGARTLVIGNPNPYGAPKHSDASPRELLTGSPEGNG